MSPLVCLSGQSVFKFGRQDLIFIGLMVSHQYFFLFSVYSGSTNIQGLQNIFDIPMFADALEASPQGCDLSERNLDVSGHRQQPSGSTC